MRLEGAWHISLRVNILYLFAIPRITGPGQWSLLGSFLLVYDIVTNTRYLATIPYGAKWVSAPNHHHNLHYNSKQCFSINACFPWMSLIANLWPNWVFLILLLVNRKLNGSWIKRDTFRPPEIKEKVKTFPSNDSYFIGPI